MSIVRSSIAIRITAAITAVVVAELTDKILDSIGISEENGRLGREIIKAVATVIASLLVESILSGPSTARLE